MTTTNRQVDPEKWKDINSILQALCEFESRRHKADIEPENFSIHKTWLASYRFHSRMLRHLLSLTTPSIPGLFRKHMMGLLSSHLFPSRIYGKIASRANAIQLKIDGNRLRAFYLPTSNQEKGLTLKIVPKKKKILEAARKELSFRQTLTELGTITIPKIHGTEEDENFLYISEELIQGKRYRNWRHRKLFKDQGIPALCNTYKAIGFQKDFLSNHYDPSIGDRLIDAIGNSPQNTSLLEAVKQAFSENPEIEVGMCHNDLLPSNLGVSDNILYFFDWELVDKGPLLPDLLKLPFKYNTSYGLVEAVAQNITTEFGTDQRTHYLHFAAFIAKKIVRTPHKSKKYLRYWKRCNQYFQTSTL